MLQYQKTPFVDVSMLIWEGKMKILIAYAGKSGTCRRAATDLAAELPMFEVTVADLCQTEPDPAGFDYVVVGGAVRYRKLHRAAREYCKKYRDVLRKMPFSLFVCCAYSAFAEQYAEWGFSKELTEHARDILYFGGELNVAAQRGFDRLIAKAMRNAVLESEDSEEVLPGYLPEHVRLFAERLRGELTRTAP